MNVFFIAVWIIVAAEKDEARPNKKTRMAVHYNGSWSRWRTDRSRSCRQKIHKTIRMYCQGQHPDQLQALESFQSKRGTGCGTRREKEWCWRELKKNFTVPAESEEICKCWTLSKMAEQLQSFKKTLTKKYIKTETTPMFTGELEKLRGHWDAFVEYKSSEQEYKLRCKRPKTTPRRKCTITL